MTPCIRHVQFLDSRKKYWGDQYEAPPSFSGVRGEFFHSMLWRTKQNYDFTRLYRCLYPFDIRVRWIQPHAQFKIDVNLILQLQLDLTSSLFPSDFLGKILSYMYSFSVSCVLHSSLTSSPIIYGSEYVQTVKLLIMWIFPSLLLLPPS